MTYLIILMMAGSCTKEPLPSHCKLPDCSDTIKYVWKRPDSLGLLPILWYTLGHTSDTSKTGDWCYATDDGVITVCPLSFGPNRAYVRKLDRVTGKEVWYWDKIPLDHYTDVGYYSDRNISFVKNRDYDAVIDCNKGNNILFEIEPSYLRYKNTKGAIIGDYYYTSVFEEQKNVTDTGDYAQLIRMKLSSESGWEKIYTLWQNKVDGFSPDIKNITIWIDPRTQDSILLLNARLYHWERAAQGADPSTLERSDVIAYNLSKRKVQWTIDSICKVSQINESMHILNNRLYMETDMGVTIVDLLNNGNIIRKNVYAGIDITDIDSKRIIGRIDGDIVVFNKDLNIIQRIKNEEYFAPMHMEYFEDYIYAVNPSNKLFVFSLKSNKIVFQNFSLAMFVPQSILGMEGRCSVDRVHRLLYCSDFWGTYCLKLPDKWE